MKVEIITEFGKDTSPKQLSQEYSSDHLSAESIENIAPVEENSNMEVLDNSTIEAL